VHITSKIALVFGSAVAISALGCESWQLKSGRSEPVAVAQEPNSRPIRWSDFETAKQLAMSKQQPLMVFFCSEELGAVAGGDDQAFAHYRKTHGGEPPDWTVFDCPRMTAEMMKAGIAAYVKLPDTRENAALFKRYGAKPGTVALLTPEGEQFAVCSATRDEVLETVWTVREQLLHWADGADEFDRHNRDLAASRFR
jgi:hypothetical protein